MTERGGELDLAEEAVGAERRRQLGVNDLERDRPLLPEVLSQVDRGHPAATDLALDAKAVGQGSLKSSGGIGQMVSGEAPAIR